MGLFGLGRAYDYQFRPRMSFAQLKRGPLPRGPLFGNNFSYHETVNIQNGPSGFWGFMTGLTQGLFGGFGGMFGGFGGMFGGMGLSMMGGYAPLGGALANPNLLTSQGTTTGTAEDKHLTSLTQTLGKLGTFSKHPDKPNIYIMTTNDGKVIEDTYQNLLDRFKDNNAPTDRTTPAPTDRTTPAPTDRTTPAPTDRTTPAPTDRTTPAPTDRTTPAPTDGTPKPSGNRHARRGTGTPSGWYRASNDRSSSVNNTHNSNGTGKTAQQITSAILSTKLSGVLNAQQQNELCSIIIRKNPSVFDGVGKPLPNADYSKLDVPTMAWIENHFGVSHGARYARQDDVLA